jgi:hypothetical protein
MEDNPNLEASTIRNTKIHKVLRGILKLNYVPKDDEFNFRSRAHNLLQKWKKILSEDTDDVPETNGTAKDRSAEPTTETANNSATEKKASSETAEKEPKTEPESKESSKSESAAGDAEKALPEPESKPANHEAVSADPVETTS